MDKSQRRQHIVELINTEGTITFAQLKREFPNVSEMTLRTDLKALDQERCIIRVHGGAKSVDFAIGTDDLLANRVLRRSAEKTTIASKATTLVRPDTSIFIDSGSTTTDFAAALPDMRLLVFTNSITVAGELSRLEHVESHIVGGRLNRYSMSTTGARAIENIRTFTFDQLFLGVTGYHEDEGFMCGSDDESVFKWSLVSRARERVVLMDSSKVGCRSTFKICDLATVDYIVSDDGLDEAFVRACDSAAVRVL